MDGNMNVQIQFDTCAPSETLRHFIECRLNHALDRYRDRVDRAELQTGAVYKPLDGRDKGCRVRVELTGLGEIVAESLERNAYVAIHRAVDRAGWEAARSLAQAWPAAIENSRYSVTRLPSSRRAGPPDFHRFVEGEQYKPAAFARDYGRPGMNGFSPQLLTPSADLTACAPARAKPRLAPVTPWQYRRFFSRDSRRARPQAAGGTGSCSRPGCFAAPCRAHEAPERHAVAPCHAPRPRWTCCVNWSRTDA